MLRPRQATYAIPTISARPAAMSVSWILPVERQPAHSAKAASSPGKTSAAYAYKCAKGSRPDGPVGASICSDIQLPSTDPSCLTAPTTSGLRLTSTAGRVCGSRLRAPCSNQADEPEQPPNSKHPQRTQSSAKSDDGGCHRHGERDPVVIRNARQQDGAGAQEADRNGHQSGLDRNAPGRVLETLPGRADEIGNHAGGSAHGGRCDQCAREPADMEADQGDENDVGAGRHLSDCEHVGKLTFAHPAADLDRLAVQLGHDRVGAADRQQRQDGELDRQRTQNAILFHRRHHNHAAAMLTGAAASTTQASGQRSKPMAATIAITTTGAGPKPCRNSGTLILAAVAIIRPAAAGATPPSTRRTVSTSPKWA